MTIGFGTDTSGNNDGNTFGGGGSAGDAAASGMDASTPWVAAADGDLALLQRSLQALNMNVNEHDENGYTLLHAAASYSQLPIMQWLVQEQHVNVNDVDQEGDSALHYASTLEAAKYLVEVAAIDVSIVNTNGRTALQAKQDELNDMMEDGDDDEEFDVDAEDPRNLREMIEYLQGLATRGQ